MSRPTTIGIKNRYELANITATCSGFVLGAGDVAASGRIISSPPIYVCSPTAVVMNVLAQGAITQGFIDETGRLVTRQVATYGPFPEDSIPLFEAAVNLEGVIVDLVDRRRP